MKEGDNMNIELSAIVMASGLSQRMGQDKLRLPFHGKELFKHIVDLLSQLPFKDKIMVSSKDYILDYSEKKGFKPVYNECPELGQSVSIRKGLEASSPTKGYMFFVADQPFLSKKTILKLYESFEENEDQIVLPFFKEQKGNPVIFPQRLKDSLMQIQGDQGGSVVIKKEWSKTIKIEIPEEKEGIDLDTLEKYYEYKE